MAVGSFTEYEQRFLLTELLKTSNAPIDSLLNILREQQFVPNWDEVGLPGGRNVNSCAAELENLTNFSGDSNRDGSQQPSRGVRRTHSASGFYGPTTPATKAREIMPKPASNGADKPTPPAPVTGSARKRGRPSNAELAQRAKERGEVYETASAKRKSIGDQQAGENPAPSSEPPAKRGRGRPPKNKPPVETMETVETPDVEETKPSEEAVVTTTKSEVAEDSMQHDEDKVTRETLEVVARAASTTETRARPHETGFKEMLSLGQATTEVPPTEQTARTAAY